MPSPSQRPSAFRPVWLVALVLPAALAIGWATGQRPAPAWVEPPSTEIVREAAPAHPRSVRATLKPAPEGAALGVAPAPEPAAPQEPPVVEVSSWTTLSDAEMESQRNG